MYVFEPLCIDFLANNKLSLSALNDQIDIALQTILLYGLTATPKEVSKITAQIKERYFNNVEIGVSSAVSFIDVSRANYRTYKHFSTCFLCQNGINNYILLNNM